MTRYRINPGEFRHTITFQKKSRERNTYGEMADNWVDVTTVKGAIYPISGKEFFSAETTSSEITHKINIRYISDISPDMRIKFGKRFFNISSVINFQERNVELQLMCSELL